MANISLNEIEFILEEKDQVNINCNITFKLILIGDAGVGKTSFLRRVLTNVFEEGYETTLGFELCTLIVKIKNDFIKLQIWDTCGMEIYKSVVENFYRNSSLAFLFYSVNQKQTFESLNDWLNILRKTLTKDIRLFLVGNKTDLGNQREVTLQEGKKFSEENPFDFFIEVSAKTGENTKELLKEAARQLYLNNKDVDTPDTSKDSSFFGNEVKEKSLNKMPKKQGCC